MANTITQLIYHIIFSTKRRKPLINERIRDELYEYNGGIVRNTCGKLIEIGGMPDHLHLILLLKTTHELADVVKTIKAKSSKWINQQNYKTKFGWQTGFGAFTVSASQLPIVVNYVKHQAEHHAQTTFREEFLALLTKHGIEFEEQYVFD